MAKDKSTRLAEIYRSEKAQGRGLGSTLDKALLEKIDPRRMFNQKGLMAAMLPSLFKAYRADASGGASKAASIASSFSSVTIESKLDTLIDQNYSIKTGIDVFAKNSVVLPMMARDTNILRQNFAKMLKLQTILVQSSSYFNKGMTEKQRRNLLSSTTATNKADMFFKRAGERESLYESERKKGRTERGEKGEKGAAGGSAGGGIFGTIMAALGLGGLAAALKGLAGGAGKLAFSVIKKIPIIGSIALLIQDFFDSDKLAEGLGIGKVPALLGTILGGTEGGIMNAFKNAGKWAVLGAGIGSVVPVVGTLLGGLIGAILGGVMGYFGGDEIASRIDKAFTSVGRMVEDAWDGLKDFGNYLAISISSLVSNIKASGKEALASAISVIPGMGDKAKSLRESAAQDRKEAATKKSESTAAVAEKIEKREAAKAETRSREDVQKYLAKREYQGLGAIAGKYESAKGGVGTISTGMGGKDPGGVSYGKYQLSSKDGMKLFLNSPEGKPFAKFFEGLTPGTKEFNEAYKQVVATQGEAFEKAQHDFIKNTHYKPVRDIASKLGFDVSNSAIQEALFSQSVQHSRGGNETILQNAKKLAGENASVQQQIEAIYKARSDYVTSRGNLTSNVKQNILRRYSDEKKDVIALSNNPSTSGSQVATSSSVFAEQMRQGAQGTTIINNQNNTNVQQPGQKVSAAPSSPYNDDAIFDTLAQRAIL